MVRLFEVNASRMNSAIYAEAISSAKWQAVVMLKVPFLSLQTWLFGIRVEGWDGVTRGKDKPGGAYVGCLVVSLGFGLTGR